MTGISTRGTPRMMTSSNAVLAWPAVAGGVIWILATLQYGIVQVIVASAWHHPPYSWLNNYISDLGNTVCGKLETSPSRPPKPGTRPALREVTASRSSAPLTTACWQARTTAFAPA
jgi:hypothetical protein